MNVIELEPRACQPHGALPLGELARPMEGSRGTCAVINGHAERLLPEGVFGR